MCSYQDDKDDHEKRVDPFRRVIAGRPRRHLEHFDQLKKNFKFKFKFKDLDRYRDRVKNIST